MNPKTVLKYASEQGARFVSVRFTDLPGSWQHLTFPISELGEEQFEDGFGFDASSIRGWAAIHESDMLLVPDATRFWMDPFSEQPTLCLRSALGGATRRELSQIHGPRRHRFLWS
jgi:glutamine synthetase